MVRSDRHRNHICHRFAVSDDINEFIRNLRDDGFDRVDVAGYSFLNSQSYFVNDADGQLLVDHLFRFEFVDRIHGELSARIGTENKPVKMNVSKTRDRSKHVTELFAPESIRIINELYHDDFVNFNYSKIIQ